MTSPPRGAQGAWVRQQARPHGGCPADHRANTNARPVALTDLTSASALPGGPPREVGRARSGGTAHGTHGRREPGTSPGGGLGQLAQRSGSIGCRPSPVRPQSGLPVGADHLPKSADVQPPGAVCRQTAIRPAEERAIRVVFRIERCIWSSKYMMSKMTLTLCFPGDRGR